MQDGRNGMMGGLFVLLPSFLACLALVPNLAGQVCASGELRVVVLDSQVSPVFNAQVTWN